MIFFIITILVRMNIKWACTPVFYSKKLKFLAGKGKYWHPLLPELFYLCPELQAK